MPGRTDIDIDMHATIVWTSRFRQNVPPCDWPTGSRRTECCAEASESKPVGQCTPVPHQCSLPAVDPPRLNPPLLPGCAQVCARAHHPAVRTRPPPPHRAQLWIRPQGSPSSRRPNASASHHKFPRRQYTAAAWKLSATRDRQDPWSSAGAHCQLSHAP